MARLHLTLKNLLLSFFLISVPIASLIACSCDTIPFSGAVKIADEIFVGRIIKAERFKNQEFITSSGKKEAIWDWRYYFEVKEKWKGSTDRRVIIHQFGTSCDPFFDIYQEEHLIYAYQINNNERIGGSPVNSRLEGKLSTWLCSRNIPNLYWDQGNWFMQDVDRLNRMFPQKMILRKKWLIWNWLAVVGISISGLGLGVLLWLRRDGKYLV